MVLRFTRRTSVPHVGSGNGKFRLTIPRIRSWPRLPRRAVLQFRVARRGRVHGVQHRGDLLAVAALGWELLLLKAFKQGYVARRKARV